MYRSSRDEVQVFTSLYSHPVATFSLMPTTYTVKENVGDAVVVVECVGGDLTFDIEVILETVVAGSTATGIRQM